MQRRGVSLDPIEHPKYKHAKHKTSTNPYTTNILPLVGYSNA
jgi:hypothetical protein